jgi:hypothetical protein
MIKYRKRALQKQRVETSLRVNFFLVWACFLKNGRKTGNKLKNKPQILHQKCKGNVVGPQKSKDVDK